VTHAAKGDFLVNGNILLEIGGKNKTATQVSHVENHLVFSDEMEISWGKQIPLYLLGFFY
jgi:hypothetical protein